MKRLLVVYDKNIKDKSRDSYLKVIKKEIPSAMFADINEYNVVEDPSKALFLKPLDEKTTKNAEKLLKNCPDYDIEGACTGKLTITAEAILRALWSKQGCGLKGKTIVIINQSDVLGKPLAKKLINYGANVISINSSFDKVFRLLYFIRPDILISASGNDDFKLKGSYLKYINTIIDLSDDVNCENKITCVPTIEVLKDRLRWWEKKNMI